MKEIESQPFHRELNRKRLILVWSLLFIIANFIMIMLIISFPWIWIFYFPLSFIFLAIFQALSHHFMETQFHCPNCNALNDFNNQKCVECGIEFIDKDSNNNPN